MLEQFIRAIIVGLCASIPLGPVAMLVVRKTAEAGHIGGFFTGLGAALVDTFYATVSVFALGIVHHFIEDNSSWISIAGGMVVALVGAMMAFRDPFRKAKERDSAVTMISPSFMGQAALLSIANPGAFVYMLALVAWFGVGSYKLITVLGIMLGTVLWWWLLSLLISKCIKRFNMNVLVVLNKLTGIAVVVFGIVWVIKAL